MEDVNDIVVELTRNFSGLGALVTAGIGTLMILRAGRSRARTSALEEAETVSGEVQTLREERIRDRRLIYRLRQLLADAGIVEPPDA